MLEQISQWFYDPVVFWGVPLILVAGQVVVKYARNTMKRRKTRR